jgi:maleate isomerase
MLHLIFLIMPRDGGSRAQGALPSVKFSCNIRRKLRHVDLTRRRARGSAKAVGANNVVVAHPYGPHEDARLAADAERYGCRVLRVMGWGEVITQFGRIPAGAALAMGRELMRLNPRADAMFFPSPHWPVIESIDVLERECAGNVMAASQACIWDALRLTGVNDRIGGYGRLLREF